MSDEKFWLGCWSIVGAVTIGIVFLGTNYQIKQDEIILKMIESGVPANQVMCAMKDSMGDNPVCIIDALKRGDG